MGAIAVDHLETKVYTVPTETPESDGTLEWDATTMVVVFLRAGAARGMGWTYADAACEGVILGLLQDHVVGADPLDIPAIRSRLLTAVRNNGQTGLCMMAVAAVDNALWDLKARLLDVPLADLLGKVRGEVPVYGSGGFTSYTLPELKSRMAGWVEAGIPRVKMKIGRRPDEDPERVEAVRQVIGDTAELFVDANGAHRRARAIATACWLEKAGVSWFEEPVVHHDLAGLRDVREHAPPGMEIAVGEYGFHRSEFAAILGAGAADVLQADATRCGISGFLQAGSLCAAAGIPFSSHCAPSLHLHPACAVESLRHIEYFRDHVRIEQMFFDGATDPVDGLLRPDLSRPGHGLELKIRDAARYER